MSAGRRPAAAARPKWRQQQIRAALATKEARRVYARGQRMRIEVVEPRLEAMCAALAGIYRLSGQPVPVALTGLCDPPALRLVAGQGG